MIKHLSTVVFAVLLMVALAYFLMRERSHSTASNVRPQQPLIALRDFIMYRYENDAVKWTVSADLGNFLEPNIVEVYGNVNGLRHTEGKIESIQADSAVAYLKSTTFSEILRDSKIQKIEIDSRVKIAMNDFRIVTEYAEFDERYQTIVSDLPVKITKDGSFFQGQRGFMYKINKDTLTVNGPLKGVIKSEQKDQK